MADSGGSVCAWEGTNTSGCCAPDAALQPCASCDQASECCTEYEFCVACCQRGERAAGWRDASKLPARLEKHAAVWTDAFDFCRSVCRTNSKSTVHENAYTHALQHHCFGAMAHPSADAPKPLPPLPLGVRLLTSAEGESCDEACGKAAPAAACSPDALPLVNTCEWLLASFPCEAGCGEGAAAHLPAYNAGSVAEASTKCVAAPAAGAGVPSTCAAKGPNARRLCPCRAAAV